VQAHPELRQQIRPFCSLSRRGDRVAAKSIQLAQADVHPATMFRRGGKADIRQLLGDVG